MKVNKILWVLGLVVAASFFLINTGCEDEKDTSVPEVTGFDVTRGTDSIKPINIEKYKDLRIEPDEVTVQEVGQQFSFRVLGGKAPYKWSVADSSFGKIKADSTKRDYEGIIYVSSGLFGNTLVCQDAEGRLGYAEILGTAGAMKLTPSSVKMSVENMVDAAGQEIQFVVVNGISPITWKTSHPDVSGVVNGLWKSTATKTSNYWATTTITITAKDSRDVIAEATITFE